MNQKRKQQRIGRRFWTWLLVLVLCLNLLPVNVLAAESDSEQLPGSGWCGSSLSWQLDNKGILTISGTGKMNNWIDINAVPWYSLRESVVSVVIEEGAESIGSFAFRDFTALTDVTIPDSVKSIYSNAFMNCRNLTRVEIPASVTEISTLAFNGCINLSVLSVSEENQVYASENNALYSKDRTVLLYVPEGKSGEFDIADGVTRIGNSAFYYCENLTGVTLPDSVTEIGMQAFNHCTGLTAVEIPGSVTTVGMYAFMNCSNLSDVTFSSGMTQISAGMFYGCSGLTVIEIPAGITSIGSDAFSYCCNLDEIVFTGKAPALYSSSFTGVIAAAYYPEEAAWSLNAMKDYGGALTWISYTDLEEARKERNQILSKAMAAGSTAELPADYISYESANTCVRQYSSEAAGGIYFLQGSKLKFLDLSTGISTIAYNFPSASLFVYQTENMLYWSADGTVIVYDLDRKRVDHTLKLEDAQQTYGIGADAGGRIYISTLEDGVYYLNLYSPEGSLLDRKEISRAKEIVRIIYEFAGFGGNGEVYFTASCTKWVEENPELLAVQESTEQEKAVLTETDAGGNDVSDEACDGKYVLCAAKVSGNSFCELSEGCYIKPLQIECEIAYYQHQNNAAVFEDGLLADQIGKVYDISDGFDGMETLISLDRGYDEELPDSRYDTLSVGTRMLYDQENNTVYAYCGNRVICRYDPASGDESPFYETQHYVFNLLSYGDSIIAVEKENGVYYIEQLRRDSLQEEAAELNDDTCSIILDNNSYVYDGTEKEPAVTVKCGENTLIPGTDYMVSYENNVEAGENAAVVIIKGTGNYTGEVTKTFTIARAAQTVTADISSSVVTIGKKAEITVRNQDELKGEVTYTSSRGGIASVNSSGVVTGIAAGTAVITVTAAGDSNYEPGSTEIAVTVKKIANSITASDVTKNASAVKTQTFSLGAKAKGGTLSYSSNNSKITVNSKGQVTIAKNYAGTAKITITAGSDRYAAVTKTVTVTVKQIANTITASNFTKTYSAKDQTFSIGVKRNGNGKVTYSSSSKSVTVSSTGKIKIKAKYMGKATITIKVAASGIYKAATKKITVTVTPTKTALSGVTNTAGLKMLAKWKKNTVGTGYQIQYSTDKAFKTGVKTVTVKKNSTVSATVSKLTKGKTYYVRIRTYKTVSGTNYYSGWSSAKSVKINK